MSRRALILVVSLVSILAVVTVYFGFYGRENKIINSKTEAATSSKTLASQAEWNAGTKVNIDSDSVPGSIKMDAKTATEQDLTGATAQATGETMGQDPMHMLNNFCHTDVDPYDFGYGGWSDTTDKTLTVNLGETKENVFFQMSYYYHGADISFATSTNGSDWTGIAVSEVPSLFCGNGRYAYQSVAFTGSFVKMTIDKTSPSSVWEEFKIYKQASVHTSQATQLDGTARIKNWTTFVPTNSPAGAPPTHTTEKFRFRTSDDHTTWGSWTASTDYAGSIDIGTLLGNTDKVKRYLQVETTLANDDGASTPTLDAYTANYNYAALDHLVVTPANASVQVNGTQSLTASAIDDFGDTINDAIFSWSTTCGSVGAAGTSVTFTAPAAVPVGNTCTVTATSTVDGITKTKDALMTITAAPPNPPTCSDGSQNGDETGIDCGGSCPACSNPPDTCNLNGSQDNGETGVDCGGGGCGACVSTCTDGVQNGDETGVDTGGSCPPPKPPYVCPFGWALFNNVWFCGDPQCIAIDHIAVTPDGANLLPNGSKTFTAKLYKADGTLVPATDETPTWTTTGGTIIDNKDDTIGYVAPAAPGTYTITAKTCNEKTATVTVIVAATQPYMPKSIAISTSPDEAYLHPSQTQQYSATVADQDGNNITSSCPVTWSMQTPNAGSINSSGLMTATSTLDTWMDSVKATANCYGSTDFELMSFVTTNEARRLEYVWTNPWSTAVKDPIKTAYNGVNGYDQFNLFIPNADYSMSLLDNRIGTIPTNGRNINIATSNNYGCYPNKVKGTAVYDGVEKSAFGSITIYPADYAFNSSGSGCEESKISLSEKILAKLTGVNKAYGAQGQVFTSVAYGALTHFKPGQIANYYGNIRDQAGAPMSGVRVEYILRNPDAGQLSASGQFIASANLGSYPGAVEIKATEGTKVISKTFDVTVTNEQRTAKNVYVYGPTGSTDLSSKRILKMWKGSDYSFYSTLADQFKDPVGSVNDVIIEDVSGQNLVDILGSTTLQAKNTEGVFKNAIKVSYDIDRINRRIVEEDEKILGPSPVIYLTLDINSANNNPAACLVGHPPICDPLDPSCVTPCTGASCTPVPPCTGALCSIIGDIKDSISTPAGKLAAGLIAIAGLLALLAQLIQFLPNLFGLFAKGKDQKHAPGIVYDSSAGVPIPLTKVLLYRARDNKLLTVVTTDRGGRFALEVPPGEEYYLETKKEGYEILNQANSTIQKIELAYDNNYFAKEKITFSEDNPLFNKSIPMSATAGLDLVVKKLRSLESISSFLRLINIPIILLGLAATVYSLNQSKTIFNFVMLGLYAVTIGHMIYKKFIASGKSVGIVYKSADSKPVDLAVIRAKSQSTGKLVKTTVTNQSGKFSLALPKDIYSITVTKSGLQQPGEIISRVKSNFKPRAEKIAMIETVRKELTGQQPEVLAAPIAAPFASSQPATKSRSFESSAEIIEKYSGKIDEIKHNITEQPEIILPPVAEHPNWKFN